MADSTANQSVWGFITYAENNPYSSLNSVHWDEIKAMMKLWATVNLDESADTYTTTRPSTFGTEQDVPGPANDGSQLVDESGISGTTPTVLLYDQAMYPQRHYGT